MIFKKKPKCEVLDCNNNLPEDPAIIVVGEHEFKVCDECALLMSTLQEKFEEREDDEQPF